MVAEAVTYALPQVAGVDTFLLCLMGALSNNSDNLIEHVKLR